MEIINNRFRLKELLRSEKHVTVYSAYDMRNDNNVIQLHLLNTEYTPKGLIDFYRNRFIELKNLTSDRIVRNFQFNSVSYIDNRLQTDPLYFYTSEYIAHTENLFSVINQMNSREIIDCFVDICSAVYYLHLKGFIHGALGPEAVRFKREGRQYRVLLKDIATVQLEKQIHTVQVEQSSYQSPNVLAGMTPDIRSDMYSLAVLLVAMLSNNPTIKNPKDELKLLRNNIDIEPIIPVVERLLKLESVDSYQNLFDVVEDINNITDSDYSIVRKEELDGLNLHTKLVGRDKQIEKVFKAYEKMVSYQPSKRIYFIQGTNGIGKTRFLQELNFLFDLSEASVYSSYSLINGTDDSKKMWVDILRKLIMETDRHIVEKYNTELMKYFPELIDNDYTSSMNFEGENYLKYRLLNRIAGFINESIQGKPAVIIIDNIHLADEFTIDTFHYLSTEVLVNTNLMLVFSCDDSDMSKNSVATNFIYNLNRRQDTEIIRLEPLDEEETGAMIQSILSMGFKPKNLANRIYSQSYGNPLFIIEIMKDLYSRHIIYVGEKTGRWQIDLPEGKNYQLLELPTTIEHALINQLNDLEPDSLDVLINLSIFSKPITKSLLEQFLKTTNSIEATLDELVKKGVLQRIGNENTFLYDFRNKVLKNIVYDRIDEQDKIHKHYHAAIMMEEKMDISRMKNLDELIYHFEQAQEYEKAKAYYLENAKKMMLAHNTQAQIENLKKALELSENANERTVLHLEIGELFSDMGDISLALEFLAKAEQLARQIDHPKYIIDSCIKLGNAYLLQYKFEEVMNYIQKAEVELQYHPDIEARLEIKRLEALLLLLKDNQINEAKDLFHEVIDDCGNSYLKTKGHAYRTLSFIYIQLGKPNDGLKYLLKSANVLEKIEDTRGVLLTLNNIGALYGDIYEDLDKAMEYHLRVKNLSEEYGIYTSEVYALLNIGEYNVKKYDFETAFDHFNLALTKTERYQMPKEKYMVLNFLTQVSIERNHFSDALDYYSQLKKDIEANPNKGFEITGYYFTCVKLYQALGRYEEADYYNQKIIQFHNEHENILRYSATVHVLINQLREMDKPIDEFLTDQILKISSKVTNKAVNIENLCEAIQLLCIKGEYELAKRVMKELEKYITPELPERLEAVYEHAKGIIEFGSNPENSISFFEKGLYLAKNSKSKELTSRIQANLGNCYFNLGKYYEAADYYLEAIEGIKEIMHQLPDEYKLDFVNGRNFSKEFYRLVEIKNWLTSDVDATLADKCLPTQFTSLEDLQLLINMNQVKPFIQNQKFMHYISGQYMEKLSDGILHRGDLLKQMDHHVSNNLDRIIKFLAGRMLATKGFIIAEDKGHNISVLSSLNENDMLPTNHSIINRVRSTLKPVLLSAWTESEKRNYQILPDDIKAVMCIPILKKPEAHHQTFDNSALLGFLYLETDKVVNNFHQKGLEKSQELVNFLVLLLEKRQLMLSASIDKLTGALTRKYLEDALQNTLDYSRKNGREFSIIMYDLDKFKGVNDRYGHQIGDKILSEVCSIILDNLGSSNILGRYGGEEFIIILPDVNLDAAKKVAENLRKEVANKKLLGEKHEITISMGLVSYPEHGQTVRELILKADQALYVAKENGRNNSQVWQREFEYKVKPANKLTGIISGDEIRDSRNVLALVELIQLTNMNIPVKEKIYQFLGRMIEITEAQYGYILLLNEGEIIETYGRKSQEEAWIEQSIINPEIVSTVIENKQGLYTIDWDETEKINPVNGLPDWDSILTVPIIIESVLRGVIYISVPARIKEFGADELNVLNVYSELVANIIK